MHGFFCLDLEVRLKRLGSISLSSVATAESTASAPIPSGRPTTSYSTASLEEAHHMVGLKWAKRADSSTGSGALERSTPVSKDTTSMYASGAASTLGDGDAANKTNVMAAADRRIVLTFMGFPLDLKFFTLQLYAAAPNSPRVFAHRLFWGFPCETGGKPSETTGGPSAS